MKQNHHPKIAILYIFPTGCLWDWRRMIYFFVVCFLFRTTPAAYGSSWQEVESELQLLSYTTATAVQDLSSVYPNPNPNPNPIS